MQKDLTTGSVFKNVLYFSLPYLLSYFLQTLYGMADLFIIGRFEGTASITAVSIGSQIMHMITVMLVGLAMGVTVGIGRAVGAHDDRGAGAVIGNAVMLFLAVSVAMAAVLTALVQPILSMMSTPAEAVPGAAAYLTICFIGIPCITAYNIIASIFRGLGDSRSPMYFIAVACAANIGLDYLFMGALHMGPAGAALGTTLAQGISVIVSLGVILRRKSGVRLHKSDLRPQKNVIGRILRIGVPVALQDGLIQISFLLITVIANRRGLTDAAAVGIVEKIISFLFLVPSSMLSTVSALCAQNMGAGSVKRIREGFRACTIIGAVYSVAAAAFIMTVGKFMTYLFVSEDVNVIMSSVDVYLKCIGIFFIPLAIVNIYRNGIQGLGYGLLPMMAGVAELIGRGVVAVIAGEMRSYTGVCLAGSAAWSLAAALLIVMYFFIMNVHLKKVFGTNGKD